VGLVEDGDVDDVDVLVTEQLIVGAVDGTLPLVGAGEVQFSGEFSSTVEVVGSRNGCDLIISQLFYTQQVGEN